MNPGFPPGPWWTAPQLRGDSTTTTCIIHAASGVGAHYQLMMTATPSPIMTATPSPHGGKLIVMGVANGTSRERWTRDIRLTHTIASERLSEWVSVCYLNDPPWYSSGFSFPSRALWANAWGEATHHRLKNKHSPYITRIIPHHRHTPGDKDGSTYWNVDNSHTHACKQSFHHGSCWESSLFCRCQDNRKTTRATRPMMPLETQQTLLFAIQAH